jgi:anti-sigma factor RsiW
MELLSALMDGHVSPTDRFAVRLHTLYCRACGRYRKQILKLRRMLRAIDESGWTAAGEAVLTAEARDRILQNLHAAESEPNV